MKILNLKCTDLSGDYLARPYLLAVDDVMLTQLL